MKEETTKSSSRGSRISTRTLGAGRTAEPGTQFPSVAFGKNVLAMRTQRGLDQTGLATLMNHLGFAGWTYVTVSDIERGVRATGVDELFGLALALKTYVVALLDPFFSGDQELGIDLGVPLPDDLRSDFARAFLLNEKDPWQRERYPGAPYGEYRKQFERLPNHRELRLQQKKKAT